MTRDGGNNPQHDTLDNIRRCFSGLCLYAAQQAAAGEDTSQLREFALNMTAFWGLDEDEKTGDDYEPEFDHAVLEAAETGTAPEMSEESRMDVLVGLHRYQWELDVVGGQDEFYTQCRTLLESLRQTWNMDGQEAADALTDRSPDEKEEILLERLDHCLMNHVNAVVGQDGHPTIAELYALAPLISTHEYLSGHGFATEEVDALLRFQDPLEVVAACGEVGNPIAELFLEGCLKRGRAEERFPLVNTHSGARAEQSARAKTSQTRKNRSAGRNQGR